MEKSPFLCVMTISKGKARAQDSSLCRPPARRFACAWTRTGLDLRELLKSTVLSFLLPPTLLTFFHRQQDGWMDTCMSSTLIDLQGHPSERQRQRGSHERILFFFFLSPPFFLSLLDTDAHKTRMLGSCGDQQCPFLTGKSLHFKTNLDKSKMRTRAIKDQSCRVGPLYT